jgi:hypothetical protein
MHIQDPEQKRWIQQHVEGVSEHLPRRAAPHPRPAQRRRGVRALPPHPLRGPEAVRPRRGGVGHRPARHHARRGGRGRAEAVMGMAHRGRLNVLANIVGKSYGEIFEEFEGNLDPESVQGSGDVKYHKGASGTFVGRAGGSHPGHLASNPSHLEAVDPVVEGMARAKQDALGRAHRRHPASRTGRGPGSRCCPSSSTATPPSPVRAWWPRPSTCPAWPATAPAARCTWSSTTSSASPPPPRRPARRSTRPTWRRWSRPRSST